MRASPPPEDGTAPRSPRASSVETRKADILAALPRPRSWKLLRPRPLEALASALGVQRAHLLGPRSAHRRALEALAQEGAVVCLPLPFRIHYGRPRFSPRNWGLFIARADSWDASGGVPLPGTIPEPRTTPAVRLAHRTFQAALGADGHDLAFGVWPDSDGREACFGVHVYHRGMRRPPTPEDIARALAARYSSFDVIARPYPGFAALNLEHAAQATLTEPSGDVYVGGPAIGGAARRVPLPPGYRVLAPMGEPGRPLMTLRVHRPEMKKALWRWTRDAGPKAP